MKSFNQNLTSGIVSNYRVEDNKTLIQSDVQYASGIVATLSLMKVE